MNDERPEILAGPNCWIAKACRRLASLSRTRQFGAWRILDAIGRAWPHRRWLALNGPDNQPFFVDVADGGFHFVMSGWDRDELGGAIGSLPCDAISIDVGAHWGVWSRLLAQQCPHGRVYAVEPSRKTHETLVLNCAGMPNIRCINKAVCRDTGSVWFSGPSTVAVLRHMEPRGVPGAERVDGISLRDMVAAEGLQRLDFLKVDVEGFEDDVILPAIDMLRHLATTICFEHIPEFAKRRPDGRAKTMFRELEQAGYRISRLDSTGRQRDISDRAPNLSNNYLAVPVSRSDGTHQNK